MAARQCSLTLSGTNICCLSRAITVSVNTINHPSFSETLMEIPRRNDFCIVRGGIVPASLIFLDQYTETIARHSVRSPWSHLYRDAGEGHCGPSSGKGGDGSCRVSVLVWGREWFGVVASPLPTPSCVALRPER